MQVKLWYDKEKLTRTAHHSPPTYCSIYEQSLTVKQLVREGTTLNQTLILSLQIHTEF